MDTTKMDTMNSLVTSRSHRLNLSLLTLSLSVLLLPACSESKKAPDAASSVEVPAPAEVKSSGDEVAKAKVASETALVVEASVVEMAADSSTDAVAKKSPLVLLDEESKPEPDYPQAQAGVVTAGEWNDLKNWDFWIQLIDNKEFADHLDHWQMYPKHRVSVHVHDGDNPISNAVISLNKPQEKQSIWTSRTDNQGNAVLWSNFFDDTKHVDFTDYTLTVNGQKVDNQVLPHFKQVVDIDIKSNQSIAKKTEIAFIVDATGSMQDEIDFLKSDLQNVIKAVGQSNSKLDIETSAVFYRDEGQDEEYLIRKSDFDTLNTTVRFIKKQEADGGGDFPEAVEVALETAINKLDWSDNAHARLAFLLLDAPPHHDKQKLASLRSSIKKASEQGIKIIPITASGIDKETEFLMRSLAMGTNGTYTFITDDSGVGNSHLVASVGDYDVEKLNALLIRLIKENTK